MLPTLGLVLYSYNKTTFQWRPIAFISRSLTKPEQNYSTTEKELLAIVWSFQRLHPYLHGTNVQVETDHQPLLALLQKKHPPGRLLRWELALQEYQFTLAYRKGTENILADGLSRIETQATQVTNQIFHFRLSARQMANLQQQDPQIRDIILQLRSTQCHQNHQ